MYVIVTSATLWLVGSLFSHLETQLKKQNYHHEIQEPSETFKLLVTPRYFFF